MVHNRDNYSQINTGTGTKHLKDLQGRFNFFVGGQFADSNLSSLLYHGRVDGRDNVSLSVWSPPAGTKPPFSEAVKQKFQRAQKGDAFGPPWSNHWFKVTLRIPPEWEHYERVQFEFDCSGEAMVFNTDGDPQQGLTGGDGKNRRVEYVIPMSERKKGTINMYLEASCNAMFGLQTFGNGQPLEKYPLLLADLVAPNMDALRLMYDFQSLDELQQCLPKDSALGMRAQWVANEIINTFDKRDTASLSRCRQVAQEILGQKWDKETEKDSERARKQQGVIWALGHCHIDTAWLWPFSVTQQKSARSWSTQLNLMDRYPEYRFTASQAQQYKWLEELYPSLFSRVKDKIDDGLFQPVGCTWVEMDTNMPSGEALCRQFLYGQRYFQSRFGMRSKTCLLPDTFGFSGQMPQICRLSGAQDFFTIKLSWNLVDTWPHTLFNWVGIDGSQVLTHIAASNTYGSQARIEDIYQCQSLHKNLDASNQTVLLFGNGDGGGGPTAPMLESLRRGRAITKTATTSPHVDSPLPLVKMGGNFTDFFDSVREETDGGVDLPTWRGEMYLEFHRGTYTSHGAIKRGNRKSEILAQQAEYAATMASLVEKDYVYPHEAIDRAWEDLLLCQFHDVLPGSGINMIYEDAQAKYDRIAKDLNETIQAAHKVLYSSSTTDLSNVAKMRNGSLFAINTLPGQARREVISVPSEGDHVLRSLCHQYREEDETCHFIVQSEDAEAQIVPVATDLTAFATAPSARKIASDVTELTSSTVKLTVKGGRITSLIDLATKRELIAPGQTGGFVIMDDIPNDYDAWEIESFHLQKQRHLPFESVRILEDGPVRTTLGASVHLDKSKIDVEISVDCMSPSVRADGRDMIRFKANIDWRQTHEFLKFELPVNIHSETATFDSQFGTIQRPTHRNTSWDAEKFEVVAHKFVDLSEYGYGVAVINESKYGHAVNGNVMTTSLLRSPKYPDPTCDMGKHEIEWAIYPHLGTFTESDVAHVAAAFNAPMKLRCSADSNEPRHSFAQKTPFNVSGAPDVILETIKRGDEDRPYPPNNARASSTQTIILRLHEKFGGHACANLNVRKLNVKKAELVNILEDHMEDLTCQVEQGAEGQMTSMELCFRGFEIKTVKLTVDGLTDKAVEGWVEV